MNLRASFKAMLIVVMLCSVALAYLWLHGRNIRLTEREMDLAKQRRVVAEEVEDLEMEVARLAGFARAESLWIAQGRPGGEEPGGLALEHR
uniref:Cell division protein FtsL n=1 Tax=candidate division WOR-3 bacterium TaxID=2052148 RepID=A0A7C4GHI3_UNCW3